ncbi:MAG: sugar-transfer associated ATP-grasp domain-containing protein [Erysipelotrichaceae bacterium]|nr:sugar-transfer associated ATP-grasp domain-containing protein [Erysipelotrichaceae bacterium]
MDKIKNLLRRIGSGSFKRMFYCVDLVHKETGKSKLLIFIDMSFCILFYNVGYLDYHIFGFGQRSKEERKTYLTYNLNSALFRMMDDKEVAYLLKDKLAFNNRYKEYIGRDFFDPSVSSLDEFKEFTKNKKKLFIKPSTSFGGLGEYKAVTIDEDSDIEALYKHLLDNKLFVEDLIEQHPKMSTLSSNSINTVRIVTLVKDNKAHFLYSILRMGIGEMSVDNSSSGGLNTCLDEKGRIIKACFSDKTGLYYTNHPTTGMYLVGFEVPMYQETIDLCLKAALEEPRLGYIGFDVAITPKGPIIVEANDLPGYDMPQNHGTSNRKTGILPDIEKIIGTKLKA